MLPSTPRTHPLWGWTTPARTWFGAVGSIAALVMIVSNGFATRDGTLDPTPRMIVDPNTAPPAVLGALPKLGPAMVGRIVAERNRHPYRSIDDLDARVRGIGPATISALRPYLEIARPETRSDPQAVTTASTEQVSRWVRIAHSH